MCVCGGGVCVCVLGLPQDSEHVCGVCVSVCVCVCVCVGLASGQ